MDIQYRSFNKNNDYQEQRKLFELSFPESIGTQTSNDNHYKWKFESFPHEVTSYQYVASEPNELVGYYAALPYKYQIAGKQYICGMVCDVMTHPDRRGKGIFTKIGHFSTNEMKNEEIAFTTGYPIRPEVIPGHIKVGWKIILEMPMYLRLIGTKSLLPGPFRFMAPIINPLVRIAQAWTMLPTSKYYSELLTRDEFRSISKDEYQLFLDRWLSEHRNALVKTMDFLNWRTAAPGSDYRFILLKKDNQIIGMSIVRPTILKGVECLAVLDIMILNSHFKASKILHQSLYKLARTLKKDAIVCMTSKFWAKNYHFMGSLYIKTPAIFSLIVKRLNDKISESDLLTKNNWHLFWIDSDDV